MVIHYQGMVSWGRHPSFCEKLGKRSTTTIDEDKVTCKRCLKILEVVTYPFEDSDDDV